MGSVGCSRDCPSHREVPGSRWSALEEKKKKNLTFTCSLFILLNSLTLYYVEAGGFFFAETWTPPNGAALVIFIGCRLVDRWHQLRCWSNNLDIPVRGSAGWYSSLSNKRLIRSQRDDQWPVSWALFLSPSPSLSDTCFLLLLNAVWFFIALINVLYNPLNMPQTL